MKVTNTERMSQLASCISTNVSVIVSKLGENALNTKVSKISDKTVADLLNDISQLSLIISGDTDDARYYYADIDLPYSEDTFPVEHR